MSVMSFSHLIYQIELPADYLTNGCMVNNISQSYNGAYVFFESRFYGNSVPGGNLSTENLAYNTVAQNAADVATFAQNATLPLLNGGSVYLAKTPKICVSESIGGNVHCSSLSDREN